MGTEHSDFYYENGFYYTGSTNFSDLEYSYKEESANQDSLITVEYEITFEGKEEAGLVIFDILPEENVNGFVIKGKQTWFWKLKKRQL